MSDYVGQPPHGGHKITHHELCFEDCAHWDCMGCCNCPDEHDVAIVETLTATTDQEWLACWFADQIAQARQAGRDEQREADAQIVQGLAAETFTGRTWAVAARVVDAIRG